MKTTLVIVDMEKGAALGSYHGRYLNRRWWARHEAVMGNILKLAQTASETVFISDTRFRKKQNTEIMPALQSLTVKSRQFFKKQDDGSDILARELDFKNRILLVGMNTDACILRTARGLLRKGFNVAVAGDACWSVYAAQSTEPHHRALSRLRQMGVEII